MKFIKKYATTNDALADNSLITPFVGKCDSADQLILYGGSDEPFKLIEVEGQLVPETKETYMYFEALQAGSTVYLFHRASPTEEHTIDLKYSTDECQTWNQYTIPAAGQNGATITLSNVGSRVYFKGNNPDGFNFIYYNGSFINKYANYFLGTGQLKVAGSIMSLLYNDNFKGQRTLPNTGNFGRLFQGNTALINASDFILPAKDISNCESTYICMFYSCSNLISAPALPATTLAQSCYSYMFYGCSSLTNAPALPATTLANYCYYQMFYNCSGLTSAPALPATTLANYCYQSMFYGCSGLTSAPALPATTLAQSCYSGMFAGCSSLTSAPALPATTLASNCYSGMFQNCSNLTSAPALPATTLASNCYSYMFRGCSGLTSAPALPVTTLADYCYSYMFRGCSSLTSAPALPATTLAQSCYSYMFYGCSGLTSAPALPATTLANWCYQSMFYGCSGLTSAPALPATTLAQNCYQSMFQNCSNLSSITCLATNISAYGCTTNWVSGVAASGTFTKNSNMSSWTSGANGIPSGWTVQDYQG